VIHHFAVDVDGPNYGRILRLGVRFASLACVVREPIGPWEGSSFMEEAEEFWLWDREVYETPGRTYDRSRLMWVYEYNNEFVGLLERHSHGLLDRLGSRLPTDFYLMREDGSAVLGAIADERCCYVDLNEVETADWLREWPGSLISVE